MFYVIEQTNKCNLRCKMCPNRFNQRPKGYMTPEMFKDIIDQQIRHNGKFKDERVAMHGLGEPLLSPYLFDNLDYLQARGFNNVDFSDNGMLFTEEIARKLCKYTIFNFIKISFNSSRKEIMEEINTGSDYETVLKNIRMFADIIKETGANFKFLVQLMHTSKSMDETPEEMKRVIDRDNVTVLECRINDFGAVGKSDLNIDGYNFWDGNCVFADTSMQFHWDGDMVGCCADDTKGQVYGNAKDGIYSEKVEAKKNQFRRELCENKYDNLPTCKKCEGKNKL